MNLKFFIFLGHKIYLNMKLLPSHGICRRIWTFNKQNNSRTKQSSWYIKVLLNKSNILKMKIQCMWINNQTVIHALPAMKSYRMNNYVGSAREWIQKDKKCNNEGQHWHIWPSNENYSGSAMVQTIMKQTHMTICWKWLHTEQKKIGKGEDSLLNDIPFNVKAKSTEIWSYTLNETLFSKLFSTPPQPRFPPLRDYLKREDKFHPYLPTITIVLGVVIQDVFQTANTNVIYCLITDMQLSLDFI